MKFLRLLIVILLVVISFSITYYALNISSQLSNELDKERYSRMLAEEKFESSQKDYKSLESNLIHAEKKNEGLTERLDQLQTINKDLKAQVVLADKDIFNFKSQINDLKTFNAECHASLDSAKNIQE